MSDCHSDTVVVALLDRHAWPRRVAIHLLAGAPSSSVHRGVDGGCGGGVCRGLDIPHADSLDFICSHHSLAYTIMVVGSPLLPHAQH